MSLKIAVITSTTRPTRAGQHVANWFMSKVEGTPNIQFDLIDLKEENLPFLSEPKSPSTGEYELESTKKWSKKIQSYDGYIFVTAEYNNSIPAPLKNALDSVYHEWDRKPAAFVGYGSYGATRAIEHLGNIVAKMGMAPLNKTPIGIIKNWESIKEDGSIDEAYVMGDIEKMIDNLAWWAKALKSPKTS